MPEYQLVSTTQDEQEGVFVRWFEDRFNTNNCNIYVQHVDVNGQLRWNINGIPVSPQYFGYDRVEPQIAYSSADQSLYLFWEEERPLGGYASFGLCGQKMSSGGSLKWGNLGKTFAGFKLDLIYYLNTLHLTPVNDLMINYEQEYDSIVGPDTLRFDQLFASRIDTSGAFVWPAQRVLLAATSGSKFYPDVSSYASGCYVTTWAENRNFPFNPDGSIYAQNIDLNGNLGPLFVPNLNKSSESVMICPNPSNGNSQLVFNSAIIGTVGITIYNSLGQMVLTKSESSRENLNTINLDVAGLEQGAYYVKVTQLDRSQILKWIITY